MASSPLPPCKARKADGSPCKGSARPGSDYCTFHEPGLQAKRAEGRRKGGQSRKTRKPTGTLVGEAAPPVVEVLPLDTADDVRQFVARAMNEVRGGGME